mgnify:CR=1 FL=1
MQKGIALSKGIAVGKAFLLKIDEITIQKKLVGTVDSEIENFKAAVNKTVNQLKKLIANAKANKQKDLQEILSAHLLLALDEVVNEKVVEMIKTKRVSLVYALKETTNEYIKLFNEMEDPYLKERVVDLIDVSERIIKNALNIEITDLSQINENVILVVKDLKPSLAAEINPNYIKGFITETGGLTSHTAIIAKMLNIPAIILNDATSLIYNNEPLLLDGYNGYAFPNYDAETFNTYQNIIEQKHQHTLSLEQYKNKKTITKDKKQVPLYANINTASDLKFVLENTNEGIGLFRTELLFLNRNSMPTEDEQFLIYKDVLTKMNKRPVIVRTLDIGTDKTISYLPLKQELNPNLGKRGIRLSLAKPHFFKMQLKALYKASVYGNLKIMFPMIANLDEYLQLKELANEVKAELSETNTPYKDVPLGIMIEVPAAALTAAELAKEADFFSIGTNDLIQYTMAADKNNEELTYLYKPFNLAIIKLLDLTITAAKANNIEVGVCGEMANDKYAIPLLIGLGIDNLSVTPADTLNIRKKIHSYEYIQLKLLKEKVLTAKNETEVLFYIKELIKED